MPKLFHLRASPRADPVSAECAEAFVRRFQATHPEWEIDAQDLWREATRLRAQRRLEAMAAAI